MGLTGGQRKALVSLFGGVDKVPAPENVEAVAKDIFQETGISGRSADQLFDRLDVNHDGNINEEEFIKVIHRCCDLLAAAERSKKEIPDNHVVAGSCAMNARSGTNAFRMQVVRRSSMRRLWKLFQELDTDGDGLINLAEFKRYMSRKRPSLSAMSTSIFYSLDKERHGNLSFKRMLQQLFPEGSQEDIQLLLRMAKAADLTPQVRPDASLIEEIRNIFEVYDDDHSGSLDEEEFVNAMQIAGFDEKEAIDMFKEIDGDHSGEVTFEEFEFWYVNSHKKQAKVLANADHDSDSDAEGL